MKALIIEDELPSARRIERLLFPFEVEIVAVLTSIKQTVAWLKRNEQPDIIFLDVHLSDGLCFEIFNRVEVSSKIIFTTAYSNYSIRAFNYNSISYLLKPIKIEQLTEALNKATAIKSKEEDFFKLKELFNDYEIENFKTTFTVKNGRKIKIIDQDEIACFYSFDNATFIKTKDFKGIINYSLTDLEDELNPNVFFRVSRSFIVHINAIKDIISYTNSRLKIVLNSYSETEIIVSRERVKDFKGWIE